MESCIYCITNDVNGKRYIGQTVDYRSRLSNHIAKLKGNRHVNVYLQRAWNKYGEEAFTFKVIELCDSSRLDEREQYYIKLFKTFSDEGEGYNLNTGGAKYRKHSRHVRSKMSLKARGRVFSEQHRHRMSLAARRRIIPEEIIEKTRRTKEMLGSHRGENNHNALITDMQAEAIIRDMLAGATYDDIHLKYAITKATFYNLKMNRSYKHVLPEVRKKLLDKEKYKVITDKAVDLYLSGMSQNAVSKKMSMSRNTLREALLRRGIDTQLHKNQFYKSGEVDAI